MYKLFMLFNIFGCYSYRVVKEYKTWWDANEYCKNTYNTDLVTITDSTMNANIFSDITSNTWIGYYDAYIEGNWKWIGYNKTTFTNWGGINPDNNDNKEDCADLLIDSPPYWNDGSCSGLHHFVCADFNDYPDYYTYKPTTSAPTTTYSPTINPSLPPTGAPTILMDPTYSQTMNDMKEVRYNAVCSNLVDNYDLKYEATLEECIAICENIGDLCRMISFYPYFKSVDDSRCYIFDSICNIVAVDNNEAVQSSILYYKVNDDDLCVNYPTNWVDSISDNCDAYLLYDWCKNGTIKRDENDFYELMNHGLDAMDTCCECGGGANIVDDIAFSVDIDWIDYNTDILCSVSLQNKSTSRDWDNLYLYHFCESLQPTNCAYLLNTNFNPTNYSYSIYLCNNSQFSEESDFEFIMNQQINNDRLSHDTYVNLQWFNIDTTSYSSNISIIYLNYSECIHSLLYIDSNNTNYHGIHPCYSLDTDSVANNTTNEPTTIAPDSTTKVPDSTTNAPDSTTNATDSTTNAPDSTTNAPDSTATAFVSTKPDYSTTAKPDTTKVTVTTYVYTTISRFTSSHYLRVSSVSDIAEVPPYENMFESETGTVVVITISILSLCLLIACVMIMFLWRKKYVAEMKDNMTEEGDNYNDKQNVEPSAPALDGNDTKKIF